MLGQKLLCWYAQNARDLPWRKNDDPYRVWVSEVMLQQTRVEAVLPRYEAFLRELLDVAHLAAVPDERLNKLWEGLGYYARARNMKKAAMKICELGGFPSAYEELLRLPGFGPYTAGAVSSIAFHKRHAAIDGNLLRIFARLTASDTPVQNPGLKLRAEAYFLERMPQGCDPGTFNQALMDLGAGICTPGNPSCESCPVQAHCEAYQTNTTDLYPVRAPKAAKKEESFAVYLIVQGEKAYVRKRPGQGMLAGMWEFPHHLDKEYKGKTLVSYSHIFTHRIWHMDFMQPLAPPPIDPDWILVDSRALQALPMPSAMAPFRNEALKHIK